MRVFLIHFPATSDFITQECELIPNVRKLVFPFLEINALSIDECWTVCKCLVK